MQVRLMIRINQADRASRLTNTFPKTFVFRGVITSSLPVKTLMAGIDVIAAIDATAVHGHFRAIGKRIFNRISVEVLIDVCFAVRGGPIMASTECLRFDGPRVLHPAKMIDVMDVKIAVAAAARPKKAVEPADLPQ